MIIAHVLSSFGVGGQERVALDLAAAQRARGHTVIAVSLAPPPEGPLAEEFRNYWCAVPGARGRKLDWAATFRNRCLQRTGFHHPGARREGLARRTDGVAAAAERVLQRRGLGVA